MEHSVRMVKVTYISPAEDRYNVELDVGLSLMEGGVNNNVEGIVAECGGACACATCHCYIDETWLAKLPQMDDMEDGMLEGTDNRKPNSRLACQIVVTEELDGIIVNVAENEG